MSEDADLRLAESKLLGRIFGVEGKARPGAKRHLVEGLLRRVQMTRRSRFFLLKLSETSSRAGPLSMDQVYDCNLHLNSYYVQTRGALDNLAWAVQHQWQLFEGPEVLATI